MTSFYHGKTSLGGFFPVLIYLIKQVKFQPLIGSLRILSNTLQLYTWY